MEAQDRVELYEKAMNTAMQDMGTGMRGYHLLQAALNGDVCQDCKDFIHWIDCPTGGWWAHITHPADNHDAVRMT